ncbi:MAG: magnesium chelatase, partial [Candidatus Omnitrophota bacterium]
EPSSAIKARVNKARAIQGKRFSGMKIFSNSQMAHKEIRKFCTLTKEAEGLLKMAINELGFSARAYDKILKASRTIADLAGSEEILVEYVSEAIQYRSLDRQLWG